jgi:hypothetical protein
MALRKKHEVLEEPQDYEIERRETPRYNPDPEAGLSAAQVRMVGAMCQSHHRHRPRKKLSGKMSVLTLT